MTTGQRIREARKRANMTQADLAGKLGISYVGISQWERGVRKPKFETLSRIATALNVRPYDIIGDDLLMDGLSSGKVTPKEISEEMNMPLNLVYKVITSPESVPEELRYKVSQVAGQLATELSSIDSSICEIPTSPIIPPDVGLVDGDKMEEVPPVHIDLRTLMSGFYCLNEEGQKKAVERVQELTEIPRYQRTPEPPDTHTDPQEGKGGHSED